jgi:nitrite reductase/ring-hydroxylating ferredoxin subunit
LSCSDFLAEAAGHEVAEDRVQTARDPVVGAAEIAMSSCPGPAITVSGGTSFAITAPAPTTESCPTVTPGRIVAAAPIHPRASMPRRQVGSSSDALADRCTHGGAPLEEGVVRGDCIESPWHASQFYLRDGSVRRGSATRPQLVFEVREAGVRIEVRRF